MYLQNFPSSSREFFPFQCHVVTKKLSSPLFSLFSYLCILFFSFSVLLQPPNSPFLFYLKNFYPKKNKLLFTWHDDLWFRFPKFSHSLFTITFFYLNTVHIDTKEISLFPLQKCSKKWNKSPIKISAHLKRSLNCLKTTICYNSILFNINVWNYGNSNLPSLPSLP